MLQTLTHNDILYKIVRTLKDEHINKIDEWEDVLLKLYHGDKIFKRDGILYVVSIINEVQELKDDVVIMEDTSISGRHIDDNKPKKPKKASKKAKKAKKPK